MSNFEKITESPEKLGKFLISMSIAEGPWDAEFQKRNCANCLYLNCDACPHEEERNNPTWWLKLDVDRKANIMTEEGNTLLEQDVLNVGDQAFRERINEEKKRDAESGWDWDKNFERGFDLCIKKREFGIMLGALHELVTPLLSRKEFRVTVIGDPEKDDVRIEYRRD